jgi:hypothetical protein
VEDKDIGEMVAGDNLVDPFALITFKATVKVVFGNFTGLGGNTQTWALWTRHWMLWNGSSIANWVMELGLGYLGLGKSDTQVSMKPSACIQTPPFDEV